MTRNPWTHCGHGRTRVALTAARTTRHCDTCGAVIPRGTPYRVRHTAPDAVDDAFADAEPAARVTATTTPEGLVRVEVYQACAARFTEPVLPDEAVDAVH